MLLRHMTLRHKLLPNRARAYQELLALLIGQRCRHSGTPEEVWHKEEACAHKGRADTMARVSEEAKISATGNKSVGRRIQASWMKISLQNPKVLLRILLSSLKTLANSNSFAFCLRKFMCIHPPHIYAHSLEF